MGFFTILAARAQPNFTVHKFDVNLWLLPGLFGRTVTYCDVGIKLSVPEPVRADDLKLTIGMPFRTAQQSPTDLIPIIETNRNANLVFGNGAEAPKRNGGVNTLSTYDDEDGKFSPITLLPCDGNVSELRSSGASESAYTTYTVVPRANLEVGAYYYLRVRFKIADLGQVWLWQRSGARRSFAIADLRANEFRDTPSLQTPPYWAGAVPLAKVNFFLVMTAKLKEQRRSPEPRYLRPLETHSWEEYLGRRLTTRQDDSFLIYYWRKEDVTELSPFRAFLEVEKRRPTAAIYAWISTIATVGLLLLLWPSFDISQTLLAQITSAGWGALVAVGVVAILGAAFQAARLAVTTWGKWGIWLERFESRRYRIKK